MTQHRRIVCGAAALMLCLQYLIAEGVAAAAWTRPYSYSRNFISDLGITQCVAGGFCSPRAIVMNTGFVMSGLLAVAAAWLLAPLLRGGVAHFAVLALATIHGVGSVIVGLVHSAPATAAGTPHLHVVGAYAAILGGNLGLMAAGALASSAWANGWFRFASVITGLFGLGCGLSLVATREWPPGLLERGAVDTITTWEVATGVLLAIRLKHVHHSCRSVRSPETAQSFF